MKYSDLKLSLKANTRGHFITQVLNSTQQATSKSGSQAERISWSLFIFPIRWKQSNRLLNVCSVLQCNIISGKRFHSSTTFFLISKWDLRWLTNLTQQKSRIRRCKLRAGEMIVARTFRNTWIINFGYFHWNAQYLQTASIIFTISNVWRSKYMYRIPVLAVVPSAHFMNAVFMQ